MKSNLRDRQLHKDDLRYPAEVITGLALGCLAAVTLLAFFLWLLSQPQMSALRAAVANPSSPAFFAAWIGAGLLTALLITAGFVLSSRIFSWRESRDTHAQTGHGQAGFLPVTGEDQDEDTGEE